MRGLLYRLLYRPGFAAYLFLAAFILFLAVTVSTLIAMDRNKGAAERLIHTHKVMQINQAFLSSITSAESNSRSYRLIPLRVFKGAFIRDRDQTYENFTAMRQLTDDNPIQRSKMTRLKELLDKRFEYLEFHVQAADNRLLLDTVVLHKGHDVMSRIRVLVNSIGEEENRLMEIRNTAFEKGIDTSTQLELAGLVFGLMVFALSYLGLSHQSRELRNMLATTNKLNAELQRSRSRLEIEVERQTRQLREANEVMQVRYHQEKEEMDRKSRELEDARRFQESMLPRLNFPADLWEIGAIMKTAMEVGGDYYDFVWNEEDNEIKVALGDAAGHGLLAAMIVSTVRSYFQANAHSMESPALLDLISEGLNNLNMRVALMGLAIMRIRNRNVEITSAGMPPILIWRSRERRIEPVVIRSIFLGSSFEEKTYEPIRLQLDVDDVILACSDGVLEARNHEGELFGMDRLSDLFATVAEESAQDIVMEVFEEINEWIDRKSPADDISLIAIRVK